MGMKLLAMVIASMLALPSLARADEVLNPPGGQVVVQVNNGEGPQPTPDRARQRAKNRALKAALMAQFDMNGDGKLGPRERMRAVRVLRRIEMKLAGKIQGQAAQGRMGRKGQMRRKLIERFDTNHDGTVDQSEMPPGAARKLRRFDRDRDGWLEPNESAPQ
jgi:hypothetical protein